MGQNAEVEALLETAEVVSVEDVGMGVTNPKNVILQAGDRTIRAVFKPIPRGRHKGFWESYQAEVAAYKLDKLLGLNMVPPTVVKRIDRKTGSLQYWVDDCQLYRDVQGQPPQKPVEWSHQLSRMKMFDNLIQNRDRNAQNFLVDPDWHIVLIDHSRAFISDKKLPKNVKMLPSQFDRRLVEKLKALDEDDLKRRFKGVLMGGQVKGILARRDALLEYLGKLIAEKGEARVLF
ncbi:MAG: hypothetical protein ACE5JI_02585 [Acidobacteriota bacterium]